jgi:hypothetical protein
MRHVNYKLVLHHLLQLKNHVIRGIIVTKYEKKNIIVLCVNGADALAKDVDGKFVSASAPFTHA